MEPKPWWASKTIWANVIAFGATMLLVFGVETPFELTPEVQAEIVAAIMAVVNIVLRFFFTGEAVTKTAAMKAAVAKTARKTKVA